MNARAEAFERLEGRYEVRVLEPSPPAVEDPPWFADDPVARGEVPEGRLVVSPVGTGDLRWGELVAQDASLAQWCAERWLGAYNRLAAPPPALVSTRRALHKLAERVISPARQRVNGKIGLRYTRGGFGTPFFGAECQIRVAGTSVYVQDARGERQAPITMLADAAALVGIAPIGGDEPLAVDEDAARFLGDWYGFAASVLEELRCGAVSAFDPSRVQLWPEHFDLAVELGLQDADARAAFGCSPGDDEHPEPYIYVAPWVAPPPGDLWQAVAFAGAELALTDLLDAADQREAALEFFRVRLAALAS